MTQPFPRRYGEGLISAISAGFFFILIGIIFVTTPNLFERILDFFRDFDFVRVPNTGIFLPAPFFPRNHQVVYRAAEQFEFAFGLFHIVILGLRFVFRSAVRRKAETAGNIVFWLGTGYLTRTLLIETTRWFEFWAVFIMLIGVTLIVRAIILAIAYPRRRA